MTLPRRRFLSGAAAAVASPWLGERAARRRRPRFSLGVASGQPRADGMVLWTRLTGGDLARRETVRWELADDEAFTRVVARGEETAEAGVGTQRPRRARRARRRRAGTGTASARSASEARSAARAPRRAADAAATLRFAIASCQRYDVGHYAAWRHVAGAELDLVIFLGDYIYEYATRKDPVRPHGRRRGLHARPVPRPLRHVQERSFAAGGARGGALARRLGRPRGLERLRRRFAARTSSVDTRARRAAAYRAYWEHMPFPKSARPVDADMRIVGRLDWGRLARIHLLDDRQYRDPQACPRPDLGGSNTVALAQCPALDGSGAHAARRRAGALARRRLGPRPALEPASRSRR